MALFHLSLKSGKKGTAANHANYIARQGKHCKDESNSDLVTTAHGNLPEWADNDPIKFWRSSDCHERANGAAYREFVLALPNELSTEQHLKLVEKFIQSGIGDKPFQYAIHESSASIGEVRQPHAHVMFSDRVQDEFDRTPKQHFSRYNSQNPELGGCKKDSGGKCRSQVREDLIKQRESWASITNNALESNGHPARVDHRSHRDRGLVHPPEKHIGQYGVKTMSKEEKKQLQASRQQRQ